MPTGIVEEYDPEKRQGYLIPDSDKEDEKIPFELDEDAADQIRPGDAVSYDVEGGMAGIMAVDVRKL